MSDSVRIIGLGQAAAGDDGVALYVLERVRHLHRARPAGAVEFVLAPDPSRLVELLCHAGPVWIVDAVVGAGAPGKLRELTPEMLSQEPPCSLSSHGMDVRQAIDLCSTLYPGQRSPEIRIMAISIDPPRSYGEGLSAPVADAAERCVARLGEAFRIAEHRNGSGAHA